MNSVKGTLNKALKIRDEGTCLCASNSGMQEVQVRSLVGELRSRMPHNQIDK